MRWLPRLLYEKRKKPRRPEARVFPVRPATTPVMGVLAATVNVITGALRELGRQHRENLQARQSTPSLPAPRPTSDKDAPLTTPRSPSKPTNQRQQPRPTPTSDSAHGKGAASLADLKRASTAKQRKGAALKHPELRPPHDALSLRENTILELAFWQGLTYKEVGQRFTFSAGRASAVSNRALQKLSYHVQRGGSLGKAPPGFLERLDELQRARSVSGRKAVAARYPELRPPHAFLQPRENDVLERFYWQGQTFDTIAEYHSLTRNQASKVRDDALRKLEVHHPHSQAQDPTPPPEVGETVSPANEVAPRAVVLGEDARITAFRRLGHPDHRRKVAGRYPELRPPHPCLSETENDQLELVFWQGRTFSEIASLRSLPRKEVGTRVRRALEQLNRHLCSDSHHDEDRLDEVLLALNECGSVRRAAKKLRVGKDVLKAFVNRNRISASTVFEVDEER